MSMSPRSITPPPHPTPETNWSILDSVVKQQVEHALELQRIRDLLIEISGRSGQNGRIGQIEKSRERQGQRLGDIESEIAKLKQTRAQLYLLGVIALSLLGAVAKLMMG